MLLPKDIQVVRIEYDMNDIQYKANILAYDGEDAIKFLYDQTRPNKITIASISGYGKVDAMTPHVVEKIKELM